MTRKARRWITAGGWMLGSLILAARLPAQTDFAISEARWEIDVATGVFWKVGGGGTPLSYTLLPQIVSLRMPPISVRPLRGGTLVYRTRLSVLLESIIHGPEHSYVGSPGTELEFAL